LITFYGASTTIVFKLQLFKQELKGDTKNKLKFILKFVILIIVV